MVEKSFEIVLTENEQTILGLFYSVELNPKDCETNEYLIGENQRIRLDQEGILKISKRRLQDEVGKISEILKSLLKKKMISFDNNLYESTELGKKIGKKVRSKWSSEIYDDLLIRCANSPAYAKFCELVYGMNLLQFNVVDMQQLDLLLDKIQLKTNDYVIDLGCGLGKITEYISQKTGSKILGIDSSQKAIEWAQNNIKINKLLNFEVIDINELEFPSASFDVIIAIDVLYWIEDLGPVIHKLKDILKPNGRMGIFYVLFRKQNDPIESINIENSNIGKLLEKNNFKYEAFDISQNAIDIWKQKLVIGKELRDQFEKEGNVKVIDDRLTDGVNVIKNFENNLQKRYFIYIENKN